MTKRAWTILWLALSVSLQAQERTPVVQSVDLLIPMAPMTVPIAGKTHIVYELHITNFLSVDVSLVRLQVLAAGSSGISIADYRGEEVRKRVGRPGLGRDRATPDVIGPGMRAVAYLWIELAGASAAPPALRHRLELDILRQTGSMRTVVEDAPSRVSTDTPVVLDPPLRGGPWTAIYDPLLMGGHRTAIYTLAGRARIPARFAIDWIRVPSNGAIERDRARRSADWNGYGAEVLAVADALVAAAMDDIPENADDPAATARPVAPENASGNYVALDLGRGRTAFYEHLKRGSVTVKAGDRVKSGRVIGKLGNSGSSSIGPHLHFHVSDASSPLAAEGLPFVFTRFQQLGAFPSIESLIGGGTWVGNSDRRAIERSLERPAANSVIQFR
jgi:murein DD-endopeptidase